MHDVKMDDALLFQYVWSIVDSPAAQCEPRISPPRMRSAENWPFGPRTRHSFARFGPVQEKKLTPPEQNSVSVQEQSDIMASFPVKVVSFGPRAFACKICRSPNTWETHEEAITHIVGAHDYTPHEAMYEVDSKIVPPCKKVGCGLCCTGLGPGNHKYLDKKSALEHLVNHLVYGHGFSHATAIEKVEAALPDDKDHQMEVMMAMIRDLQAKVRRD